MTTTRASRVLHTVPLLIAVCLVSSPAQAQYGGGTGQPGDPYLIHTAEQMNTIGTEPNDWDKHFKLMADIDLAQYTDEQFNVIGYFERDGEDKPFTGVFDGNGKTVSNFTYISADEDGNGVSQQSDKDGLGIFGYARWAVIRDLTVTDPNITVVDGEFVGALAGMFYDGTVTRCSVEGGRISAKQYVGGMIGGNSSSLTECSSSTVISARSESGGLTGTNSGDIHLCHTTTSVEGRTWLGGLVGRNYGVISQSHSNSIVRGLAETGGGLGGLVGYNERGEIVSCYSLGSVSARLGAGGLCGGNKGSISSCYSAADVTVAEDSAGGLIGSNYGTVTACKATGSVKGVDYVGGLVAGNGGVITHCYAEGAVQGASRVVGLGHGQILFSYSTCKVSGDDQVSGFGGSGSTYLCYWDTEASEVTESATGKGKTTAQMKSASTYRGWGSGGYWVLDQGNDYPRLAWEGTPGNLLVDPLRTYGGGAGEPNDPYRISTAEQFVSIAYYPDDFDKSFVLTNDINLGTISPEDMIPIGTSRRMFSSGRVIIGSPFEGSFAGNSHTISNFTCHEDGQDLIGVFGNIGQNGRVENVHVENTSVSGNRYTGGLAGQNLGVVRQCSVTGMVEGGTQVGGLVGSNGGFLIECSTSGQVVGSASVGGIVGNNRKDVSASCSRAIVKGKSSVGGIAGMNGYPLVWTIRPTPPPGFVPFPADCSVSSCYFIGSVEGPDHTGGVVGFNGGLVRLCYSAASVTDTSPPSDGQTSVGGLVGTGEHGVVLLSYWDAAVSGRSYSAGGRSKTTEQMMEIGTFRGWGYLGEWVIDHGNDYPHLAWEGLSGEPVIDDSNRYAAGTGQPDDPYQIHTEEEFTNIGYHLGDWDSCFTLASNLDLRYVAVGDVLPIGALRMPFTGSFDGNGHIVSNFVCLSDTESYYGVFGSIGPAVSNTGVTYTPKHDPNEAGSVTNLHLENVQVSANYCAGGLAGYNSGIVSNCSVSGSVIAVLKDAGGLMGYNAGWVSDCNVECSVASQRVAGGLIGHNEGPVTACSAIGTVEGEGTNYNWCAGGLIGDNFDVVESCHFVGDVTGGSNTGGLTGVNAGTVVGSSASGNVTGTWNVGGLVGENEYGRAVATSFSDSFVTGDKR
ncbi:MAG: GLUG motif-containing protein, partial [Planctomycetota bacterium]